MEELKGFKLNKGVQLSEEEIQALSKMEGEPLEEYWDPVTNADVDIGDLSFGSREL